MKQSAFNWGFGGVRNSAARMFDLFSSTAQSVLPPPPATIVFGALTLALSGGIPVPAGATAITGGTVAANYTVASGHFVPLVEATCPAGTLTFNDPAATTLTIQAPLANRYSCRTQAEMNAVKAKGQATISGKKILVRPTNGVRIPWANFLDGLACSSLFTVSSHEITNKAEFLGTYSSAGSVVQSGITNSTNVGIEYIDIKHTTDTAIMTYNQAGFLVTGAVDNILIQGCNIHADLDTIGYGPCVNGIATAGIATTATLTIVDNILYDCRRGIMLNKAKKVTVKGNILHGIGLDGMVAGTGGNTVTDTLDIIYNTIYDPRGSDRQVRFEKVDVGPAYDYLYKDTPLTGVSDGKLMFAAFQYRNMRNASLVVDEHIVNIGPSIQFWRESTTGKYELRAKDTAGNVVISMTSTNAYSYTNQCGPLQWILLQLATDGRPSKIVVWNQKSGVFTLEAQVTVSGNQNLKLTDSPVTLLTDSTKAAGHEFVETGRLFLKTNVYVDAESALIQSYFLSMVDGDRLADRMLAVNNIGAPEIDFIGRKDNDFVNNKGTGGAFLLNGAIDVGHGDQVQTNPAATLYNLTVIGNDIISFPNSVYAFIQYILQNLFNEDIAGFYNESPIFAGNRILAFARYGIYLSNPSAGWIFGNTMVMPSDAAEPEFSNFPGIVIADHGTTNHPRNNLITDNYCWTPTIDVDSVNTYLDNNISAAIANLATHFTGPSFNRNSMLTVSAIDTVLAPKAGGPLVTAIPQVGAISLGTPAQYFDRANKVYLYDHPRFNNSVFTPPANVTGAALNALTLSAKFTVNSKRLNVDRTEPTSSNGSLVRCPPNLEARTLNAAGTVQVAPFCGLGGSVIVYDGEQVELRGMSSSSGLAAIDYVIKIGKVSFTWRITTQAASAPSYAVVETDRISSDTVGSVFTFNGVNLGTAAAGRINGIMFSVNNGSTAVTVSSATIDGQAATVRAQVLAGANAKNEYYINAPSNANPSGQVVITMSASCAHLHGKVYAHYGAASAVPSAIGSSSNDGGTAVMSANVNTANPSQLIAMVSANNASFTYTWAGGVEDDEWTNGGNTYSFGSASKDITAASTPLTVSATATATMTNERLLVVVLT